jgi:hypothetical protein
VLVKTNLICQSYISALAGRDGGGRERAAPDCRSGGGEGAPVHAHRRGAGQWLALSSSDLVSSPACALVARGGGGRRGGRLKAALSIRAGAASPLLEDRVKP